VIVDCSYCRARVQAVVIASYDQEEDIGTGNPPWPCRVSMLVCSVCDEVLLVTQNEESCDSFEAFSDIWPEPYRLYPPMDEPLPWFIPPNISDSIKEARSCLRAEAYSATAVMCGKAIEGLCRHFNAGSYLGTGLRELRTRGIIDGMLIEWGEELQRHRNKGAHESASLISKQDASDLLDFAIAICSYVFDLSQKFRDFKKRTSAGVSPAETVQ
jgi:hypothetical protein